jgi:nicotinamidase-related amidase
VRESEPIVHKIYGDAFEDTELDAILRERGVGELLIVGGQTDACIRSTLHGAFARGYDTTLVADAHTGPDRTAEGGPAAEQIIALTNRYWACHTGVGRVARVMRSEDIVF